MGGVQAGIKGFVRAGLAALLLTCSAARAGLVAEWNAIALKTATASTPEAVAVVSTMALVHVTMLEVMSFVEGGYSPRFLVTPPAPLGRSGEAAAAAAAHHLLCERFPAHQGMLNAALERSLASLPEQDRASTRVWGRHLAANIAAVWPKERPASRSGQSIAGIAALNASVAGFIDAKRLKAIDAAWLHARVWTAVSEAHAGDRITLAEAL